MICCDCFESCFNLFVCIEAHFVNEIVETPAVKLPFDFREYSFDRVEFRRVTDIPNGLHVQFWPPFFDARLLVDRKIVHEQRNRLFSILGAKILEVITEIFAFARLIINPDESNALFLRHCCDYRPVTDIYLRLIHGKIRIFSRPFA